MAAHLIELPEKENEKVCCEKPMRQFSKKNMSASKRFESSRLYSSRSMCVESRFTSVTHAISELFSSSELASSSKTKIISSKSFLRSSERSSLMVLLISLLSQSLSPAVERQLNLSASVLSLSQASREVRIGATTIPSPGQLAPSSTLPRSKGFIKPLDSASQQEAKSFSLRSRICCLCTAAPQGRIGHEEAKPTTLSAIATVFGEHDP
mmetsp:Transcript_33281/g.51803  ORF Transcript_33281/g.51803 Transcript_33281/m.51803 type:complete len:209 (+) Transcript_33281:203-829(+)